MITLSYDYIILQQPRELGIIIPTYKSGNQDLGNNPQSLSKWYSWELKDSKPAQASPYTSCLFLLPLVQPTYLSIQNMIRLFIPVMLS